MTVKELIDELAKVSPDAEVWTEGCDCRGEANGVKLEDDGSVLITRSNW